MRWLGWTLVVYVVLWRLSVYWGTSAFIALGVVSLAIFKWLGRRLVRWPLFCPVGCVALIRSMNLERRWQITTDLNCSLKWEPEPMRLVLGRRARKLQKYRAWSLAESQRLDRRATPSSRLCRRMAQTSCSQLMPQLYRVIALCFR